METKERRRQIDHRQGSRSGSSLFDRRDAKGHTKHIDRGNKSIGERHRRDSTALEDGGVARGMDR